MEQQNNNYGRDQFIINQPENVTISPPGPARSRTEQVLLMAVRDEVESRLTNSLHNAVFVNLGKEAQPEQVKRPWDSEIKIGAKPIQVIPDDVTIAQVFESSEVKGKLLILGKPGSGKTTTLLDLAKALLAKAEANSSYPIPVLFNLSSWRDEREVTTWFGQKKKEKQSIKDWMVEELSKRGASKAVRQQWLSERVLLPLLDGLDEIPPHLQEKCVQQINEFLSGECSPLYVVVCSRAKEYENYETLLEVNGAVYLKELIDQQIEGYLTNVGRQELWPSISHSPELVDFVRAPLLLSMAVLAYPQGTGEEWQRIESASDQLGYLLDSYVERMLHREISNWAYGERKVPTARQTRWWLVWLAQQMERESQTEFLIEQMQPTCLERKARGQYLIGTILLTVIVFGLISGLSIGLINGLSNGLISGLSNGLINGLSNGLIFGLGSGLILGIKEQIKPVESLRWSWKKFRNGLIRGLIRGLIGGLIFGLILGLIGGLILGLIGGLNSGLIGGLILGLIFGLIFGLILGLIFGLGLGLSSGLINTELDITTTPNQGIQNSIRNFMLVLMIFGLIGELIFELIGGLIFGGIGSYGLIFGVIGGNGLILGVIGGLVGGGEAVIKHFTLRLLLYQNKAIPWNYARFLNYCTDRLFLQRVGGRYRFMHKLLQEHFARMPVSQVHK